MLLMHPDPSEFILRSVLVFEDLYVYNFIMSPEPMSWVMGNEFSGSIGGDAVASLAVVTCWQAAASSLLLLLVLLHLACCCCWCRRAVSRLCTSALMLHTDAALFAFG